MAWKQSSVEVSQAFSHHKKKCSCWTWCVDLQRAPANTAFALSRLVELLPDEAIAKCGCSGWELGCPELTLLKDYNKQTNKLKAPTKTENKPPKVPNTQRGSTSSRLLFLWSATCCQPRRLWAVVTPKREEAPQCEESALRYSKCFGCCLITRYSSVCVCTYTHVCGCI